MSSAAHDIVDLSVGAPDIATPKIAADAAMEAIATGRTRYAGASGILPLRERVAERFQRDKGIEVTADDIFVSAGAKLTVFCVLSAVAESGGNVVYATPHYGGYPHLVRRAGLEGRPVETRATDGYRMDPARLESALDDRTVAVILNAPSNPTGATYSDAELEAIIDTVCRKSRAVIISDEIYSAFAYDEPVSSPARYAPKERVVVIDGVSKAYGMSGWRIGYAAGPTSIVARARAVNNQLTNCASSISQYAAAAALELSPVEAADIDRHRRLRDHAYRLAASVPEASATKPTGGIYQSIRLSQRQIDTLRETGESVADGILRRGHVRVPQDSTFGMPGLLRVTFSLPLTVLTDGMTRLTRTLDEL